MVQAEHLKYGCRLSTGHHSCWLLARILPATSCLFCQIISHQLLLSLDGSVEHLLSYAETRACPRHQLPIEESGMLSNSTICCYLAWLLQLLLSCCWLSSCWLLCLGWLLGQELLDLRLQV
jgi:hypothetical protein